MEFMCVISVSGSLATYRVQKENNKKYKAVLRTAGSGDTGVPAEILLTKNGDEWTGSPPHEEIVRSLVHAIEATNPVTDERPGTDF